MERKRRLPWVVARGIGKSGSYWDCGVYCIRLRSHLRRLKCFSCSTRDLGSSSLGHTAREIRSGTRAPADRTISRRCEQVEATRASKGFVIKGLFMRHTTDADIKSPTLQRKSRGTLPAFRHSTPRLLFPVFASPIPVYTRAPRGTKTKTKRLLSQCC